MVIWPNPCTTSPIVKVCWCLENEHTGLKETHVVDDSWVSRQKHKHLPENDPTKPKHIVDKKLSAIKHEN